MKLKIISDFHTEFWTEGNAPKFARLLEKYLPSDPEDINTVLCCGGDMGTFKQYNNSYKPLFELLSKRFKAVICVPGNHTWYNSSWWGKEKTFWSANKVPKNVYYLDNNFVCIDDVVFIGSCLWTDFNNMNALAMMHAKRSMNDFECIKKSESVSTGPYGMVHTFKVSPEDTVERNLDSVIFIKKALDVHRSKKCVVISHHLPSELSVNERFRGDLLNAAYFTELTGLLLHYSPALWIHGHTHDSCFYDVGDTKIVCNPLGYHGCEVNKKYNPNLIMEV